MKKKKKAASETIKNQVFLEHKRKKTWIDNKSGHNGFMVYPRSLFVTWGNHDKHWNWNCYKETSDENIEVVKLMDVCWVDVRGKFKMSDLSAGAVYEIVYVVKLTKGAHGWELPVLLTLSLPDGKVQQRRVSLLEMPRGEWFELSLGNFSTKTETDNANTNNNADTREVCFDLYEHGGHWKSGLIIQGAILRPKG